MPETLIVTSPEQLAQLATLLQQASELARHLSQNMVRIPKDQVWYWTDKWQAMEREADEAYARGDFKEFDNVEDMLADLNHPV